MSRIISWLSTKNGKRFTAWSIGVSCFSTFGAVFVIHGPYKENVRELVQLHNRGKPKPLSDKVQGIVKEVLKDCKLKEDEKEKLKFFNVIGEDLFHLGGTNSPWGASIGLPFFIEAAEDINFTALRLQQHESIDWIVEGQDLIEALTIPDNAKKFVIMREIYACDIWDKLDNTLLIPVCIAFSALLSKRVNTWRNAFKKPLKSRLAVYALCYSVGFILYRLLKDPMKHIAEKKYDELAALTGPDYLEGGIEYYQHMLMRNKALRELLGKKGLKRYDENGNENYFILAPKLPTSKRVELLKKLKEDNFQDA
ncbi:transmembrane protein 177 isoform X2 [Parasteatoda tepidariorum]|nr:transmembrane protein 177 isoform X2 [Parasteatoda tepidariorum]